MRQEIHGHLHSLRMLAMRDGFEALETQQAWQPLAYLHALTSLECEERHQKRITSLLKQAHLPHSKRLEDFDLKRFPELTPGLIQRLCEGTFIERLENILIFGNPGTGKTHLSIALAREWCLRGRKVFYTSAAQLVQTLLIARKDLKLNAVIKKMDAFEVLLIDDISYLPYQREEVDVLFLLLAERYEKRSTLVTSNLVFSKWNQIFKDEVTTSAAIDRLVHHSIILELNATSYRASQASSKQDKNITDKGEKMNPTPE